MLSSLVSYLARHPNENGLLLLSLSISTRLLLFSSLFSYNISHTINLIVHIVQYSSPGATALDFHLLPAAVHYLEPHLDVTTTVLKTERDGAVLVTYALLAGAQMAATDLSNKPAYTTIESQHLH